ncbi:MAG: sialidase family protein [Bryobacterales bacterium]|nr:sialidase family protein [Bryobacterales bacterium]
MSILVNRRHILLTTLAPLARGRSSAMQKTDLFTSGADGVHTYRIPALLETPDGVLLAVADARHVSSSDLPGRISLVMRKSSDSGLSWTPAETLASTQNGGVGDASLLLDARGRVWCFFAYGPPGIGFRTAKPGGVSGPEVLQVHALVSADGGRTWSPPRDLTPQIKDPSWHACFATSGTHFVTASGRLLLPLVVLDGEKKMTTRNAYSDDHGNTWRTGSAVAPDTDESKAVEVAAGTVMQNVRNGDRRLVGLSRDGGATFAETYHDTALPDPSCNAGFARYRHGSHDLLLFTNAASQKRENLTLRASADRSRTWRATTVLHPGPAAYSTVVQLRDGSIGVLYECGETSPYERITFARLSLDAILEA